LIQAAKLGQVLPHFSGVDIEVPGLRHSSDDAARNPEFRDCLFRPLNLQRELFEETVRRVAVSAYPVNRQATQRPVSFTQLFKPGQAIPSGQDP
jgi:hypothetical protein